MKKLITMALCLALSVSLTGCKKAPVSDSGSNTAIKWFDERAGDELLWDGSVECTLDEFPGVTFRCRHAGFLEAVTEEETIALYGGMPICSVYFYDLTGDGAPEICSTINIGSGIVDSRIAVYDYIGGAFYQLSDRFCFDYTLKLHEGSLWAEKHPARMREPIESGELVLLDGVLGIKAQE